MVWDDTPVTNRVPSRYYETTFNTLLSMGFTNPFVLMIKQPGLKFD